MRLEHQGGEGEWVTGSTGPVERRDIYVVHVTEVTVREKEVCGGAGGGGRSSEVSIQRRVTPDKTVEIKVNVNSSK